MTKSQIRSYQKELRNKLTQEEQKNFSKMIRDRLYQTEAYNNCRRLFTYVSFQSEVDTYDIIKYSLEIGKEVYIPRVEAHGVEFYRTYNLNQLTTSKFGISEPMPSEDIRYTSIKTVLPTDAYKDKQDLYQYQNLMLLPGLAFDQNGNRIGYGAGYYDRYLSVHQEDEFYKIALAYDFQMIANIPADEFDKKADEIITPSQRIFCKKEYP